MVRPKKFGYNQQTASSNAFQNDSINNSSNIAQIAIEEFDRAVEKLKSYNIDVTVIEDSNEPIKPDAIFPNNWGTFHSNGLAILYPMAAPNRQVEKRPEILDILRTKFIINEVIDLSHYETQNKFLEGTGSIIFDHINKLAYACSSERTNLNVLKEVCDIIGYEPKTFTAVDKNNKEIYHTNVMMALTENLAIICLESITNKLERANIINSLNDTKHVIIDISLEQVNHFAGNMLGLKNKTDNSLLIMSETAKNALRDEQITTIEKYCKIVDLNVKNIETIGGGSTRCMISELFLPLK